MKKIYKPLKTLTAIFSLAAASFQAQTYCIPTVFSPLVDDEIGYARFGTMTNTTTCGQAGTGPGSFAGGYANYTGSAGVPNTAGSISAPVCIMGLTYPLEIGLTMCNSFAYSGIVGAFIDYNQNGVFDPAELVWTSPFFAGALQPAFNIQATNITIPMTALPGLTRLRFWQSETSFMNGPCGSITWGEVEDYAINIVAPAPCGGVPAANSVVGPAIAICPNSSAALSLASSYTNVGITYQWQSSTLSAVGPFSPIATGTLQSFATPNLTVNTWYNAVVTCTVTGGQFTTTSNQVMISPVTTNTVPYYESFEGITAANKLPNCSWAASNLGPVNQTYIVSNPQGRTPRTGTKFASFYYLPAGTNYFYTNGIFMTAGVTYSAALWYQTEFFGYNNWSDLSIMYGTTQTPTGLVSIASTNGPAISNIYKSLSNTFQVPTTGLYYVAIKGTTGSGNAPYLTWDDLSITIPCTANSPNSPTIALTVNNTTICAGENVNLNASGASTYTWNNGSNGASISDMPAMTTTYVVMGTNGLTGCMSTANQIVTVNATPVIYVIANTQSVCVGSSANLQAIGASSYAWSNNTTGSNITVSPSVPTVYSVLATGTNGCVGTATQAIGIYPAVTVSAATSRPSDMCISETTQLTASGNGVSFQWTSDTSPFVLVGNPVTVSPSSTSVFTVVATSASGCHKSATVVQNVSACTGITEQANSSSLNVYPNPTSGELSVASNNTLSKTVEVVDVTGKIVSSSTSSMEVVKLNIKDLSSGVYYVKVYSNNTVDVLKVVKQ